MATCVRDPTTPTAAPADRLTTPESPTTEQAKSIATSLPDESTSPSPPDAPPAPEIPADLLYYGKESDRFLLVTGLLQLMTHQCAGPLKKPLHWCDYHHQAHDSACPLTTSIKQTRKGILTELQLDDPKQPIRETCRIYYLQFEGIALRTMKAMAELPPPKLREIETVYMQLVDASQAIRKSMSIIQSDMAYDLGSGKPVSFLAHALATKRTMMEDAICQAFRLLRYIQEVQPVIAEVMTVGKKAFPLLRPFGKRISRNCRNVCQDHCFLAAHRETHLMRLLSRVMASAEKAGLKVSQACAYEMRNRLLRAQLLNLVDYESSFGFVNSLVRRIERGDFKGRMLDFDGVLFNHLGLVKEEPDGKAAILALYEV